MLFSAVVLSGIVGVVPMLAALPAYAIAYSLNASRASIWRLAWSGLLAQVVGWVGTVVFIVAVLFLAFDVFGIEPRLIADSYVIQVIGRAFWSALIGAGVGVYRGRYRLRTGMSAPPIRVPGWLVKAAGAMVAIGIVAAVGLPAYQDYRTRRGPVMDGNTTSAPASVEVRSSTNAPAVGLPVQAGSNGYGKYVVHVRAPDGSRFVVEADYVVSEAEAREAAIKAWKVNPPLAGQSRTVDGLTIRGVEVAN